MKPTRLNALQGGVGEEAGVGEGGGGGAVEGVGRLAVAAVVVGEVSHGAVEPGSGMVDGFGGTVEAEEGLGDELLGGGPVVDEAVGVTKQGGLLGDEERGQVLRRGRFGRRFSVG